MKTLTIFLSLAAFAADNPPAKPPQITAEQRAKFWRATAESIAAASRAQQARDAVNAAQLDMQKTCGEDSDLVAGADGEPICKTKTKEVKK